MDLHLGVARPVIRGEAPLLEPRGGDQQEVAQLSARGDRTAVPEGLVRQAPPAGQPARGVLLEVPELRALGHRRARVKTNLQLTSRRTHRQPLRHPVQPEVRCQPQPRIVPVEEGPFLQGRSSRGDIPVPVCSVDTVYY
jgi:hypothetical protein